MSNNITFAEKLSTKTILKGHIDLTTTFKINSGFHSRQGKQIYLVVRYLMSQSIGVQQYLISL